MSTTFNRAPAQAPWGPGGPIWTKAVAGGFSTLIDVPGAQGGEMYFTGTLSERARSELARAGWDTFERVPGTVEAPGG